ncbi:hypothetical protein [Rhizobium sp. S96]|uniref:hypothetical protein n=1 Tax=Rhizobium sp. S96 TaxID=3055140 RepID=UPI0025AB092F|nr:hypothetical protein [Rhizobium sp. S96]MDM9619106.1 hypothetical protein [Rhizobium sp. S96]
MPVSQEQYAHLQEAAQFALDCCAPPFKVFLHERKGFEFPLSDDKAVAAVLQLLAIRNRDEIRTDEAAAAEWRSLRTEFHQWRVS